MLGLRLGPATEMTDIDQLKLGETGDILGIGGAAVPCAVEVLIGQRLPLGRIKEGQIGIGQGALIVIADIAFDQSDRRFGQKLDRRQLEACDDARGRRVSDVLPFTPSRFQRRRC